MKALKGDICDDITRDEDLDKDQMIIGVYNKAIADELKDTMASIDKM